MFIQGYENLQVQTEKRQKEYERRNKPFRFYLKNPGDMAEVTFLDEPKQAVHEHKVFRQGQGMEIFTCPKQNFNQHCPFCASGLLTSFSYFFTVIDHRPYEGKDQKRLLVTSDDLTKSLMLISQQNGGLVNKRISIIRGTGQKSSTGGNSAQFAMRDMRPLMTDMNLYMRPPYDPDFLRPYDYMKVFALEDKDTLDHWAAIAVQAREAWQKSQKAKKQGGGFPSQGQGGYGNQQPQQYQQPYGNQPGYQGQPPYAQPAQPAYNAPAAQGFPQPPPQQQPYQDPNGHHQGYQQPHQAAGVPLYPQDKNLPDIPF